jgi:hypothetical protein
VFAYRLGDFIVIEPEPSAQEELVVLAGERAAKEKPSTRRIGRGRKGGARRSDCRWKGGERSIQRRRHPDCSPALPKTQAHKCLCRGFGATPLS